MKLASVIVLMSSILCAPLATAKDVNNSKDHPLISRYTGAVLNAYNTEDYVELEIVREQLPAANSGRKYGDLAAGKLTSINYITPAKKSALEVMRNYEKAITSAGFNILFKCDLDACNQTRRLNGQGGYAVQVMAHRLSGDWIKNAPSIEWTDSPSYFLSAQLKRASGDVYVILWVMPGYAGTDEAAVFQFLLETKPLETGHVTVNAAALDQGITADGKIALYGIYFDTAKADVKAESKAQLDEIAKLLKQNSALRVAIVGHTDNQGSYENNLGLSQRRADAVVKALVTTYKIDAKRIAARAAASMSPVASNRSDAGRSKNRRVEMVEQ